MATSKTAEREARAARDRLRRYNARQALHALKIRRRKRDNLIAIIAVIIVLVLATVTQVLYFTAGPGVTVASPDESALDENSTTPAEGQNVGDVPSPELAEGRTWSGTIGLNDIRLDIELDGAAAPQAVASLVQASQNGYFINKTCHRLVNEGAWLLQCGSVDGTGSTDPAYHFGPIENAPADGTYRAGTVAMARASDDAHSNGRQFFVVYQDTQLPGDSVGGYTVVGTVTHGLGELVAEIAAGGVATAGASANDGPPHIPTTITAFTLK
ncbi:MAG: peptidylprolyl isomerase [Homoserinimonas sp.]|nr:peptidylprolyl isomerase [Homoserinimonas sp.]